MTDQELMDEFTPIPEEMMGGDVRAQLRKIRKAGSNMSAYEVKATGVIVFFQHDGDMPTVDVLSRYYMTSVLGIGQEQHRGRLQ